MFSFGPLSGLSAIASGQPGTMPPSVFNTVYPGLTPLSPGDPATTTDSSGTFNWNGAVGLIGDPNNSIANAGVQARAAATIAGGIIEDVTITTPGSGYAGPTTVTFGPPACTPGPACQTAL